MAHSKNSFFRRVTVAGATLPYWLRQYLRNSGQSDLIQQHLATVVRLHRENRYDRSTHDVEQITGQTPQTVEQYIGLHPELFA